MMEVSIMAATVPACCVQLLLVLLLLLDIKGQVNLTQRMRTLPCMRHTVRLSAVWNQLAHCQ